MRGQVVGNEDRELVATEPGGERSVLLTGLLQPGSDLPQQLVAHGVAVCVVDGLEPVQIDHADAEGRAGFPCGVEGLLQMGKEGPSVRQVGEAVQVGETEVLPAERDRAHLSLDHLPEVVVVDGHDDEHRDGDQNHVQCRGDEGRLSGGQEERHVEDVDDQRDEHRSRPQVHQAEDATHQRDCHEEADMRLCVGRAVVVKAQRPEGKAQRDEQGQSQRARQDRACVGLVGLHVPLAPPEEDADHANHAQGAGDMDSQQGRRMGMQVESQRPGIHHQDDVEKRHLSREGPVLRLEKLTVFGKREKIADLLESARNQTAGRCRGILGRGRRTGVLMHWLAVRLLSARWMTLVPTGSAVEFSRQAEQ